MKDLFFFCLIRKIIKIYFSVYILEVIIPAFLILIQKSFSLMFSGVTG